MADTTSTTAAMDTDLDVTPGDKYFDYDEVKVQAVRDAKPWTKSPKVGLYFTMDANPYFFCLIGFQM